ETGRLPVDNPATHLELTMIHEAMVLEYSGRYLALVEWASAMRLFVFMTLLANLFFPWGVTSLAEPVPLLLGLLALAGKLAVLAAALAVGAVFLVVKAWVIPRVLWRIGAGAPVRPIAPGHSSGIALLVAGVLVVAAYVIMLPVNRATELPTEGGIPLAFAMALIGLYLCVTGRDAFGHILGFLVFENGIFALAILATYGLPSIVEAGVFLD